MRRILFFCLFTIMSLQMAQAHNPLSAAYYLEINQEFGILNVSLSQAGFQEALAKHFPNLDLDALSADEYKLLAVKYIKENFNLEINGNRITLLNGGLKLGNHETDLKFITSELPKTVETLNLNIHAFSENEHHQTVFSVLLNGETSKVILSENNKYSTTVLFENNKMKINKEQSQTNYLWILAIMVPIVFVGRKLILSGNQN
ncbi:hypothetical protein [Formosa algae]|uniref:hypothetical protein n=1 Tax=Formosa algae TaxID=225843 RepID=UPI000CCE4090|nr:hypothetical protein [Formosa algae]PNW26538.1 hypothetical protein BKP44_16525 [Formosa algae]